MTARVIAICNQKGGVGKTTTAFHLARAAVIAGKRVLLVDLDPQGNLTSATSKEHIPDDQAGVADVLSPRADEVMADVVVDGVWEGLHLVPTAGATLGFVRDELTAIQAGREARLKVKLRAIAEQFDLIIIDCAPSIDSLTVNGLTAADAALIVTHTKQFSANGLAQLLANIDLVREHYNSSLEIAGILVNQHEEQTISGRGWASDLHHAATQRGIKMLEPYMPKKVVVSDTVESATGLDEWGSRDASDLAAVYSSYLIQLEEGAS